jgi:hypothetical protein
LAVVGGETEFAPTALGAEDCTTTPVALRRRHSAQTKNTFCTVDASAKQVA